MEIEVKTWTANHGRIYDVKVKAWGCMVFEEMTQDEVDDLAIRFLDDTVLNLVPIHDIVAKLVEKGVVDKEMIEEYLEELKTLEEME